MGRQRFADSDGLPIPLAKGRCRLWRGRSDRRPPGPRARVRFGRVRRHPLLTPAGKCRQHGRQCASTLGQDVLIPRRPMLVRAPFEDAVGRELAQAPRQRLFADGEGLAEVVEACRSIQRLSDDGKRPPLPHDVECPGGRAVVVGQFAPRHPSTVPRQDPGSGWTSIQDGPLLGRAPACATRWAAKTRRTSGRGTCAVEEHLDLLFVAISGSRRGHAGRPRRVRRPWHA
jgi:hypothetical protein